MGTNFLVVVAFRPTESSDITFSLVCTSFISPPKLGLLQSDLIIHAQLSNPSRTRYCVWIVCRSHIYNFLQGWERDYACGPIFEAKNRSKEPRVNNDHESSISGAKRDIRPSKLVRLRVDRWLYKVDTLLSLSFQIPTV